MLNQPHNLSTQTSCTTGTIQTGRYGKIVDQIYDCVNTHLLTLMDQMLLRVEEELYAIKEKNEASSACMDNFARKFSVEKNNIRQQFFYLLNRSLETSYPDAVGSDQQSSMVQQDEMDEMVAITTMHSRVMNSCGEAVHHLEARLEYLELMCERTPDKESLDPKHICEVFSHVIEYLDLSIDTKLFLYKIFDREVCSHLGVLYSVLNQTFIDNKVLPEIILTTTKSSDIEFAEDEVSSRVAVYYDPEEKVHTEYIPRTREEICGIVNEFMSGDMTITGEEIDLPESFLRKPTQQEIDGKNCYERKDVLRALSNLQRKLTSMQSTDIHLDSGNIKQQLIADIDKPGNNLQGKHVNLLDERSMDFVGMMFDAIDNDETVSRLMVNLVRRLQIPLIKVAMTDSRLFDQEGHPARVTLDRLVLAGKGINSELDTLYTELVNIVDNILNQFDMDIAVFEKAVNQINSIINRERHLTEETEKSQQKQILLEHARNIVVNQLKMISANKKIPESVKPLVLKHWASLMMNRYLKYGRSSTPWRQSVTTLRLLLKCIQPVRFASQYRLLKNNHRQLAESVNDDLFMTKQDKTAIAEQISHLKKVFSQLLEATDFKNSKTDGDDHKVNFDASEQDNDIQLVQQQVDTARHKISLLPASTKPGNWYEVYTGKDKPLRRLKLSVILTDEARLVFVDRKGVQVIGKDAEAFAGELVDNRSRVLADHSTFDFALGQVIGAIAA